MPDREESPSFRVLGCPAGEPGAPVVVLVVAGDFRGPDCALADRVEALVTSGAAVHLVVDVARIGRADVGTVAALARLQVRMRGRGGSVRLRGASADLRAVLALLGLDAALPTDGDE